ncbi:hypothetical protein VPHK227_0053 [Vibrio phage K227]
MTLGGWRPKCLDGGNQTSVIRSSSVIPLELVS